MRSVFFVESHTYHKYLQAVCDPINIIVICMMPRVEHRVPGVLPDTYNIIRSLSALLYEYVAKYCQYRTAYHIGLDVGRRALMPTQHLSLCCDRRTVRLQLQCLEPADTISITEDHIK